MSEQGGKLLRLADHPLFRTPTKDPELIEIGSGEYITREELEELQMPEDPSLEDPDWWKAEGIPLAACKDCRYAADSRLQVFRLLGRETTIHDLRCDLKADGRCDRLNPNGDCSDFTVEITYG